VGGELILVLANRLPLVKVARFHSFDGLRVAAVTVILVVNFHFLLVDIDDVEVKFSDFLASIFEPENLKEVVHIEAVLVGVAFEQLSLRYDVVLGLLFFLFVDELSVAVSLVAGFRQIWGNADEVGLWLIF
jgi:hypothetical protein